MRRQFFFFSMHKGNAESLIQAVVCGPKIIPMFVCQKMNLVNRNFEVAKPLD